MPSATTSYAEDGVGPTSHPGDLDMMGWQALPLATRQVMQDLSEAYGADAVLAVLSAASPDALSELTYVEITGRAVHFDGKLYIRDPKSRLNAAQTEEVCKILAAHCPNLIRLEAQGIHLTPSAAQDLAQLPRLRQAALRDANLSDPGALDALADSKTLERLSLDGTLPNEGLDALASLPSLKRLRLESPSERATHVVGALANLEELILSGAGLNLGTAALSWLPRLRTVTIIGGSFDPRCLGPLPALENLSIGSIEVDKAALQAIADACTHLRSLTVKQLAPGAEEALANLVQLQRLEVHGPISDAMARAILALPHLGSAELRVQGLSTEVRQDLLRKFGCTGLIYPSQDGPEAREDRELLARYGLIPADGKFPRAWSEARGRSVSVDFSPI